MPIILIIAGIACCIYDAVLLLISPGTLLSSIFSFTHIWLALGALFIFTGGYRIKKGSYFWKQWQKKTKIIVICALFLCAVISCVNLYLILNPRLAKESDEADFVILLGGGIDKNGELSKTVMNRVDKASEYLVSHKNAICVVTGGKAIWSNYAEAPELKRQLVLKGIEAERILIEDNALDTIQNLQYSCEVLSRATGKPMGEILSSKVIIVSNFFHLRRAERLAHRMGYSDVMGLGIKVEPYSVLHNYVREIAAYIKLNLRILLTGKPQQITSE